MQWNKPSPHHALALPTPTRVRSGFTLSPYPTLAILLSPQCKRQTGLVGNRAGSSKTHLRWQATGNTSHPSRQPATRTASYATWESRQTAQHEFTTLSYSATGQAAGWDLLLLHAGRPQPPLHHQALLQDLKAASGGTVSPLNNSFEVSNYGPSPLGKRGKQKLPMKNHKHPLPASVSPACGHIITSAIPPRVTLHSHCHISPHRSSRIKGLTRTHPPGAKAKACLPSSP